MAAALNLEEHRRNERWLDLWTLTHVAWGAVLPFAMPPYWALVVMVLWEPFEVLFLCPFLARFGIKFGHESLRNSLMDIVADVAGVTFGAYVLVPLFAG